MAVDQSVFCIPRLHILEASVVGQLFTPRGNYKKMKGKRGPGDFTFVKLYISCMLMLLPISSKKTVC